MYSYEFATGNYLQIPSHESYCPITVQYSYNKTKKMNWFLKFIFGIKIYMFRTVSVSIIRSLVLYTQQWHMSHMLCWQIASKQSAIGICQTRYADSLRASCQGRARFQQHRNNNFHQAFLSSARQGAEGNSRHSHRNIRFFPSRSD